MKQCIREEFKYLLKAKIIVIFIIVNLLLGVATLYSNYNKVSMSIEDYIYSKESFEQGIVAGINDKDDTIIVETEDDVKYMKENAETALYTIHPNYTIEMEMISSIDWAMVIISTFIALLLGNDSSCNILRLKAVRHKRSDIFLAKSLVYYLAAIIIEVVSICFLYIINKIGYPIYMEKHDKYNDLHVKDLSVHDNWFAKVILLLFVTSIAVEIGMIISLIIKKNAIAILGIVVYAMVLPKFGTYDIRVCFGNLMAKFYDCYGAIAISGADLSKIAVSIVVVISVWIILKSINYLLYIKKSAY
ncbi:MAG: hypothetical protein K6G88_07425 [Lachnospiraceae bacterium]|nr:hypothetical protein [Lachnospiraceae bacterium]